MWTVSLNLANHNMQALYASLPDALNAAQVLFDMFEASEQWVDKDEKIVYVDAPHAEIVK